MINFDIISSDLIQDARAAVRGFRILRDQEFFKEIEKNDYIVWTDCGKHFRNNEFVGYLLLELAQSNIKGNFNIRFIFKFRLNFKIFSNLKLI